ncbi:MAG: metalloregulator ArsR/SmtB family transcription factor [Gemmatimonadaceae bacterium]|nr:metalloregulator ArsR/SmtB family transcription factor [Gemmatimonadaceae bacterium]
MAAPATLDHLSTLADSTRSRLLLVLERHEMAVTELCAVLQLPQSTISRHLKVLGDERWVESRAEGTSRVYRLAATPDEWAARLWPVVRESVQRTAIAEQDLAREGAVLASRRTRAREFFATVAGEWESVRTELFGDSLDLRLALSLLEPEAVVGDLGCGTGHLTSLVAPHVARVISVDGSEEMLAAARARVSGMANVELHLGDLEALPLGDGVLDMAIHSLVLHYVADPGGAIAEAARVLRPGGRLVVLDMMPHERDDLQQRMGHVWRGFPELQLAAWFAAAGLEQRRYTALPVDQSARGPTLFTASARKPPLAQPSDH